MNALLWALVIIGASASGEKFNNRLPGDVLPDFYGIRILTNIADLNENFTFNGDVRIRVNVVKTTNKIILHSNNLTIDEINVRVVKIAESATTDDICKSDDGKSDLKLTNQTYDKDLDFYIIQVKDNLEAGQYAICIPFQRNFSSNLKGFYLSNYEDQETGKKKWLAVTQFEPGHARKAFPCFDEPGMKARFEVTLGHIKSKSAVSNMPLLSTEPIDGMEGWVWDRFQVTVPMSTYLVVFLVSDFAYVSLPSTGSNNVSFQFLARKDAVKKGKLQLAAEIAPKILEDFEQYFNIKYSLPKLGMVAVPQFDMGAMENWGLITYRETALLFDPKSSSYYSKLVVVKTMAHEIAHQWFGNLVTMRWWTDLWLNEGFATYMATQEVHKLFPEWNQLYTNLFEDQSQIFIQDAGNSSHPVSFSDEKSLANFDDITYKKGSLIIRMINLFLGEKTFRTSLRKYLKRHVYNNTEKDDLWSVFTEQAHQDGVISKDMNVKDIMDTWTLQTGFPVLRVTRDYKKGEATVHQERFLAKAHQNRSVDNTTWWVPITYTTASELNFTDTSPRAWIPAGQREIVLSNLNENDWILLNIQMSALCRVNYDEENWNKLSEVLNSDQYEKINVLNRVQLIDDSLNLAKSGYLDFSVPLKVLKYLKREKEVLPWTAAISSLYSLENILKSSTIYGPFLSYMKTLIGSLYLYQSEAQSSDTRRNLQKSSQQISLELISLNSACYLEVDDCKTNAISVFRKWMATPNPDQDNPVPENFRTTFYCTAIKEGKEEEWNFAWQRYLNSKDDEHKSELLIGMVCSRESWILKRLLKWAENQQFGPKGQNLTINVLKKIIKTDLGYFLAKSSFTEHITDKENKPNKELLLWYIENLPLRATSQSELNEYASLVKQNLAFPEVETAQKALQKAKTRLQEREQLVSIMSKHFIDPLNNLIQKT